MATPAKTHETTPQRSAIMRSIRSTDTKPEQALAAALDSFGIKSHTRNDRSLPGTPDFAFHARRLAVFVDGAFWHGRGKLPAANRDWWREKFRRTMARDKRDALRLKKMGWEPMRLDAGFVKRRPVVAALLVWRALEGRPVS